MRKRVISTCCNASIHHFPNFGLAPMDMTIFFCDKCHKVCKTKVVHEENENKTS
jgi:hypothetical protein